MGTFWTNQGVGTPVISPTTGDGRKPQHILDGSPGAIRADAVAVFGDGSMTAPSDDPTLEEFLGWHSEQQLASLDSGVETTIGTPPDVIHVIKSEDGERMYVIEHLKKRDFALMSLEDQDLIAGTETWKNSVAYALGMVPNATVDAATARAQLQAEIEELGQFVSNPTLHNSDGDPPFDSEPFLVQLELLETYLANMAVFSPAEISKQIGDLRKRAERAVAFRDVSEPAAGGLNANVISTDGNETIRRGYDVLIEQERRIAAIQQQKQQLIQLAINGQIDAPTLAALLQELTSLEVEAKIAMDTEEINQLNRLLKDIAIAQDMLYRTLEKFDPSETDQKRTLLDLQDGATAGTSPEERSAIAMFIQGLGGANHERHPLEKLQGIVRPTLELIDNPGPGWSWKEHPKTTWDTWSTRLNEYVTIVNQENQIMQNEVSALTKEKNRHFEQTNTNLQKVVNLIGRIHFLG